MDRLRNTGSVEARITDLLHKVPGYAGYRDKENRRDEDKRLRDSIADDIQVFIDRLTKYNADLSANRELKALAPTESLIGQLRLLADRIRTASYGYGGLFSERDIDGTALDQLRQFDLALKNETTDLSTRIDTISRSIPPQNDDVRALSEEIERLNLLFSERSNVVDAGKPTRDEKVLKLLDVEQKDIPSPLLSVSKGDTLAILGDNFIANATILLSTSTGPLNLIRTSADEDNATWLLGSGVDTVPSAQLMESPGTAPSAHTAQPGTATIDTEKGYQEGVAVQYSVNISESGEIVLTLVLGDSTRTFRGNEIRDIDVAVYGTA